MTLMLPLYEAKMIHLYDTRWATYEPDGSTRLMTEQEKADRTAPMPRYWVAEKEVDRKLGGKWDKAWFLGWRDIARTTDERTVIAALLPRVAVGNKIPIAMPRHSLERATNLQAGLSCYALDFIARQKLGGATLNFFILEQLALPEPGATVVGLTMSSPQESWVGSRVDRLNGTFTASMERRGIRAELDAYYFHLYGVSRSDVEYVMETFPITKSKDLDQYGEFQTQRLVLEAYDAMTSAIEASQPYASPFEQGANT